MSGAGPDAPDPARASSRRTHWWRLPPVWVRRLVLAPAVVLAAFLWLPVAFWVLVLVAAAVSFALPGRLRITRALWLAGLYLMWDAVAVVALAALWVWHGFGTRIGSEASQRHHYALARGMLGFLFMQARWTLRLEVEIAGADIDRIAPGRPVIVVSRHAGPGDSLILVDALLNRFDREPAIVLKDTLQWDPAVDILLNRVPSRFVTPRAHRAAGAPGGRAAIASLAESLGPAGALLIFPEGANVTPGRRTRRIAALRASGRHGLAQRAEAMPNVMPPHPGGVLAALEARPDAAIVVVGHTGLERLSTVSDVWRELPLDKRIVMAGWVIEPSELPEGSAAREKWLYDCWERVDAWVSEHQPRDSEAAARPSARHRG